MKSRVAREHGADRRTETLGEQSHTESTSAASSRSRACRWRQTALSRRAPSMWIARPASRAASVTARAAPCNGQIVPPREVVGLLDAQERGPRPHRAFRARLDARRPSAVKCPSAPSSASIMPPARAPPAPALSERIRWASRWASTALATARVHGDGDVVGHGPAGEEQRRVLPVSGRTRGAGAR